MTAVVHPPNFYVSPIEEKTKTEMTPFWYTWGDQGRLAGCAEHPRIISLPGSIKNGRSTGNCAYARKGTTSRVWCFWLDDIASPGNYGWLFVNG
jgi:hypothetical protein